MSDLIKDEPVLVLTAAGAVVSWGAGQLVTHGVITDVQASAATQAVVPAVAAGIVLLLGVIARRFVTPAGKVVDVLEQQGLLTDADWARFEGLVEEKLGIDLDVTVGDEHPDADDVGEPLDQVVDGEGYAPAHLDNAGGMGAGTPPIS